MLIKIEIIILVIIIILSFVTGIIINIIDIKNGKEIKKNNKSNVDSKYEEEVNKALSKVIVPVEELIDGKTMVNINIPKVKEIDNNEMPMIIKTLPMDGNIDDEDIV